MFLLFTLIIKYFPLCLGQLTPYSLKVSCAIWATRLSQIFKLKIDFKASRGQLQYSLSVFFLMLSWLSFKALASTGKFPFLSSYLPQPLPWRGSHILGHYASALLTPGRGFWQPGPVLMPWSLWKLLISTGSLLTPPCLPYINWPYSSSFLESSPLGAAPCVTLPGSLFSFELVSSKEFCLLSTPVCLYCALQTKESLSLIKQGLSFWIFNKLPGDVNAAGPQTIIWVAMMDSL